MGLNCSAVQTRFLTLQFSFFLARVPGTRLFSPTLSRTVDHTRSSLWMPSDLFKLSLQGGWVSVRALRGVRCLPPPRDKKTPPWACQKPLTNQTSHLASSLLPFILLLLPTYGRGYFASSWGIKKRVSSGQRGRNGDTYQSAMNAHHKGPLFSHNCPPTFITWKNKQQGLP